MRKFIFLGFCSFWLVEAKAQISIYDCNLYQNAPITQSQIEQVGYEFNRPCVELDNTFNFSGSSNKAITSQTSIHIKPGFYAGNYNANSGMFLKIQPKADFDVAVMNYSMLGAILRYAKMELGITLPSQYKDKLDLFIAHELDPNLNANPNDMINPFLDEQLDVEATFTHVASGTVKKLDGFFTRDMERNETTKLWDEIPSDYHIRVRFAPPSNGVWNCQVNIKVNGAVVATSDLFNFKVIESDKHGYITVHSNKKNFALDGEVIFPVGQNIPHTEMYQRDSSNNLVLTDFTNKTEFCNDINGWKDYIKLIDEFGDLGGRFTRIFAAPHAGLVEWEEKGNYFRRMHHAFEMDNVINKLEEHDMFTIFDLLLHNYFMQYADYNAWPWDWDRKIRCENSGGCGPGVDSASYYYPSQTLEPWQLSYVLHPYNSNPGVKMPHEMFLNEQDLLFHEQRTRYYISRYGYSTQIYIWEQAEETFHLSQDASLQGGAFTTKEPYFDGDNPIHGDVLEAVANYNKRMNAYVRDHLQHNHQLLGIYAMEGYGTDEKIGDHDGSIYDPRADCIALAHYADLPNNLIEDEQHHQDPDDNHTYVENEKSLLAKVSIFGNNFRNGAAVNPFPTMWKRPVYLAECGVAGTPTYLPFKDCQAGTDEKMDNFRFGFSGIAGFNKWHYFQGNEYGVWENIIRAEQHMNGQDVKNVIGTDYIQGRQAIILDFTDELRHDEGHVLEMQYYLSDDENSAVGYVYNRTVNYRTAGGNSSCRSQEFGGDFQNFDNIVNFDWNSDNFALRTEIIDLPSNEDYLFHFYSYPNGEYLSSVTESTGTNDEIRVKFPHLTQERPVVWFVCTKVGGRDEAGTANIEEEVKSHSLIAYPNPTTGKLFIPTNQGAFEVYNSVGMRILIPHIESNREIIELDFRGLAKGIYQVHFVENSKTIKICVI